MPEPQPWNTLRIGPTKIGSLSDPSFCSLCFWRLLRLKFQRPFNFPVPALLNSLDKQEKQLVHACLDKNRCLPDYFGSFLDAEEILDIESVSGIHEGTGLTLYGKPDIVLVNGAGKVHVIDNKTARVKDEDHPLARNYGAQVNFYGSLLEQQGYEIGRLGILYYVHVQMSDKQLLKNVGDDFMSARFVPQMVEVKYEPERILEPLFAKVRELIDTQAPPEGRDGCKDCDLLAAFHDLAVVTDSRVAPMRFNDRCERERVIRQQYLVKNGLSQEQQMRLDHLVRYAEPGGVLSQWFADDPV